MIRNAFLRNVGLVISFVMQVNNQSGGLNCQFIGICVKNLQVENILVFCKLG